MPSIESANAPRPGPFLAAFFALTGTALGLEVLLTRLLSVLTWYSLAFLVIAMGLFGLTAGALRVYFRPERYAPASLGRALSEDALALAFGIPLAYVLLLVVPLRVEGVATTVPLFLVFSAIIAMPFVAAGAVIAAALTRTTLPVGRVYAVDLAGAAVGAPLAPLLLRTTDAGTAFFLLGAVAALSAAGFAISSGELAARRRALASAGALFALAVLQSSTHDGLVPLWVKGRAEEHSTFAYEAWNEHARITVTQPVVAPAVMWGKGDLCAPPVVTQRWITIDGDAGTVLYHADPDLASMSFFDCDVTNLAHQIRPEGAMAIVGVGGSRDIQAALHYGHAPVVGIELNDKLLGVLRGPLGLPTQVAGTKGVRLVHDDGRSWLSRSSERFSVVQASLIDTWASTGAGAHALGENGLYTVEAFRTFLDRLAPRGVLTMSRWFQGASADETTRLVALATAALLERGVAAPADHVVLVTAGPIATILLQNEPFGDDDLFLVRGASERLGFHVVLAPGAPVEVPSLAAVLATTTRAELDRLTHQPTLDLRPPTDDRPFFFYMLRPAGWLTTPPSNVGGSIEGNRRAGLALALSFFASLVLVTLAIVVPLARRARLAPAKGAPLAAGIAYFGAIGVGFMLVEMALLQRLSIVLGHPSYSLVVVLATLVAAAGAGSIASDALPLDRRPWAFVYPVAIAALLVTVAAFLPSFAAAMQPAGLAARIGFAVAVCGVVGFALGVAYPAGMRIFAPKLRAELPWLWGVNGVGGVLASSLGLLVALEVGLPRVLVVAACVYAALVPAIARGLAARDA